MRFKCKQKVEGKGEIENESEALAETEKSLAGPAFESKTVPHHQPTTSSPDVSTRIALFFSRNFKKLFIVVYWEISTGLSAAVTGGEV